METTDGETRSKSSGIGSVQSGLTAAFGMVVDRTTASMMTERSHLFI
jgi:hypothetical protein